MNALSVTTALTALPRAATRRTVSLRLVAHRRSQAARTPFVAVVVLLLLTGLLGLLLLNTVLAQDAFRLHALQVDGRALADREQELQRDVADLQSPRSLAARATSLGMVPGGPPAFLRLADGKVLGSAVPGSPPIVLPPAPVANAPAAGAPVRPAGAAAAEPAAKPRPKPKPKPAESGWTVVRPGKSGAGTSDHGTDG